MFTLPSNLSSYVVISTEDLEQLISLITQLCERGDIRYNKKEHISIFDVIANACQKANEREVWKRLCTRFPKVVTKCDNFKFPGAGQRETPVATIEVIIEIVWLLPGQFSDKMRCLSAKIISDVIKQQRVSPPEQPKTELPTIKEPTEDNKAIADLIATNRMMLKKFEDAQNFIAASKDAIELSKEYVSLRKKVETNAPGLSELLDYYQDNPEKPRVRIEFTAKEWCLENAPEFDEYRMRLFNRKLSEAFRFCKDEDPQKENGLFKYTNENEAILHRVKNSILATKPLTISYDAELIDLLDENEKPKLLKASNETEETNTSYSGIIGTKMKLTALSTHLGFKIYPFDTETSARLALEVRGMMKEGKIDYQKPVRKEFIVTQQIIDFVLNFHAKRGGNKNAV